MGTDGRDPVRCVERAVVNQFGRASGFGRRGHNKDFNDRRD